jgi:hypothetical protein
LLGFCARHMYIVLAIPMGMANLIDNLCMPWHAHSLFGLAIIPHKVGLPLKAMAEHAWIAKPVWPLKLAQPAWVARPAWLGGPPRSLIAIRPHKLAPPLKTMTMRPWLCGHGPAPRALYSRVLRAPKGYRCCTNGHGKPDGKLCISIHATAIVRAGNIPT